MKNKWIDLLQFCFFILHCQITRVNRQTENRPFIYRTALEEEFAVMTSASPLGDASPPRNRSSPPPDRPLLPRRRAEPGAGVTGTEGGDAPSALPDLLEFCGTAIALIVLATPVGVRAGGACWEYVGSVACLVPGKLGSAKCDAEGAEADACVGGYAGRGAAEFVCAS